MTPLARLIVTPGEPAGIGPELVVRLLQRPQAAQITLAANRQLLQQAAGRLGLPLELLPPADPAQPPQPCEPGSAHLIDHPLAASVEPGRLDAQNAGYVLETLRSAADGCLQGRFDALVTAPVHKGIINDAGIPFTGHTEFLAERTGGHPVMMLACPGLRVALATTHLPLRAVADAITPALLQQVIGILHHDLRHRFGIARPLIAVCGLNPHAGEDGHLGREEVEFMIPMLDRLRAEGINLRGPLPADTLFTEHGLAGVDAVLAMYHDQGLPVLKARGFGNAVNITLGLPIVRTSVDHGTALELAGKGTADSGSLQAAVDSAIAICRAKSA